MSMKYNKYNASLIEALVVTGMLLANIAVAAEQEYDIEIVILEDVSGRYSKSENWPIIPEEYTSTSTKQSDIKQTQNEKRIKYLANTSFKLNDEVKRIEDSKEYKVLLHTAWRQTGLDKQSAFPVHITTNSPDLNSSGSYIEGDITLVMSRYLHVSGDLTYYKEGSGSYVPYPVKFDRRMKSRETHYIDHPMIGVLVLTTPISR
jgi:Peptidoglycan-binding protein, CsiV